MSSSIARSVLVLALVAGCRGGGAGVDGGSDALGDQVRVEVAWRVRCDPADSTCREYPDRAVAGHDDVGTQEVSCRVVETATSRTLTLNALLDANTGLAVMNAELPRAGGSPTSTSCTVVALDEGEIWVGACGGEPPSVDQACQMTVSFTRDTSGPLVVGDIFCDGMIPFSIGGGSPTPPRRGLSRPGDGAGPASTPLTFAFHNCAGYVPD